MSQHREYKYWITRNCDRKYCWLVASRLDDMLSHKDTTITGPSGPVPREELQLSQATLEYVYFVDFSSDHIVTLVQDRTYFYLIDNTEITVTEGRESSKDYRSNIRFHSSLPLLVSGMTGGLRKRLGLKTPDKIKLRSVESKALDGVVPIDFIGQEHATQVDLFRRYADQNKATLDLSGMLLLSPQVIIDCGRLFPHQQVILYQNKHFSTTLDGWLRCFPKASTLSMWYIDIRNSHIIIPVNISTLEFHNCMEIDIRVLTKLAGLTTLKRLILNYEKMPVQECSYETLISDAEWGAINNTTLETILVDSKCLTMDVIDFILKGFRKLEHFLMDGEVLAKLQQNSRDGCKDREPVITFHSALDTTQGFTRRRDVKVYDLLRNKYGAAFSDSMLRVIRARDPEKSEAVDILLGVKENETVSSTNEQDRPTKDTTTTETS